MCSHVGMSALLKPVQHFPTLNYDLIHTDAPILKRMYAHAGK